MTNPTIGILGGGQLGRMLALAGVPLGFRFRFFDPAADACAQDVGALTVGSWMDCDALGRFARECDAITFEFENVPTTSLDAVEAIVEVRPPRAALATLSDRVHEKQFFQRCGLMVQPFAAVSSAVDLAIAVATVGTPGVLKTRSLGYDGKGQRVIRDARLAEAAWSSLGEVPCIYEAFVPFDREVSIVAVRTKVEGSVQFDAYPLGENVHREGILHTTIVPAHVPASLAAAAREHARVVADTLDYIGVFTIEFFVADGTLIANEMAPRVHNSGHWTIDGAVTSQFENHIRAIRGLPLGSCAPLHAWVAMLNIVGRIPPASSALGDREWKLHLYGKSARAGRKTGHITLHAATESALIAALARAECISRSPNAVHS